MTDLFSVLLQQSLTACWVIPAVLLLRFCLKKAPKRVTNLLWLVVAFRLICPVSFESNVSLVTQAQNLSHAAAELRDEVEAYRPVDSQPTVTLPEDVILDTPVTPEEPVWPENPVLPVLPESPEVPEIVIPPVETPREQPFISRQLVLRAGCGIWLAGMAAMALFGLISTRQWRKRVQTAVRCEDGLWRSESVESPFILGVLRPKIYLPFVLPFGAESHVIAHEQAHLKRRDPLWKCFAFGLLAVYWFHPLVWVSYFLFCRDIELACDQQVTRDLDAEGKKAYSRALLACTVSRDPLLCPLSFGEVGVKARVKAVLREKPSKAFVFTALVLCTVLIICCAANPKEEHPWDEAYRQTLEELLFQYGANEDYGLQSVTTLDLWEDGVPELVAVRTLEESIYGEAATILMIYEFADGQAVLREEWYRSTVADFCWNRTEQGVTFLGLWPLTDKSTYPGIQGMATTTLTGEVDEYGYQNTDSHNYIQIDDGRWIIKSNYSSTDSRFLTDKETAALFDNAQSLMGLDWQKFLRNHRGAVAYQRAYYDAMERVNQGEATRFTTLVDFDLDGIPEMIINWGRRFFIYSYDTEKQTANLLKTLDLTPLQGLDSDWRLYLNMTLERPALIVLKTYPTHEYMEVYTWGNGNMEHRGDVQIFTAKGDWGARHDLTDHRLRIASSSQTITDPDAYEAVRAAFLLGATEFELSYYPRSLSAYDNPSTMWACEWPVLEPARYVPADYPGYREVLTRLIAQYGCYDMGDGTLPVLGLKYAALHDFGWDGCPELVTLVNHKNDDQRLHMTLRIYGCDGGETILRYTTELGTQYGQTDLSYAFTLGEGFVATYHSRDEWTEELIHITEYLGSGFPTTRTYLAKRENSDELPTEGTLTQFWEDGEPVSLAHYGNIMEGTVNRYRQIDACWNVSPASETDLKVFLEAMGMDPSGSPTFGQGETAAEAHHNMLSGLMTVHGTTPDGIVGATIVDLEQDGIPELLVQHGMALELYRYEKNHSRLIWSGPIGVRFGQTDASYEYIITTHIDTFCIIVHDSQDAWMEEVWRVITLENGVIHEEELRAWAEADTSFLPERDNLIHFSIDGAEVPKKKYDYRLGDLLDGSMAVSAVHPYARPNSDEYMAQLLTDLAAGNLPEIGDSAACATAWWLMATNDGEPLDEETALKFGAAKRTFPAESPIPCFEGAVYLWNEPYDFCRYVREGEQYWLILADREETTEVAMGRAYRLDENGALRQSADTFPVDTFTASLVGDFDGQTLVHRRYHTDCYSGMEDCEDCFRSTLYLWNVDHTEYVKLIENAPLANHFEVVSREGNIVTVTYQTGPAHSEYNKTVTVQVDLNKKTCTQAAEPDFSVAYGELTYRGKTYGLPQYPQYMGLTSGEHTVEQVGKHLLITTHVNPDDIVYDVFNTETLAFEKHFWGLVLDWQGDDLTTLIYCQWNTLFTFDDLAIGEIGQSVMPKVFRVEEGWFSYDGSTFTISYSDDTRLVQQEVFPMPDREILVAANTLDGRTIWRTGLLFCPTYNGLTNTEALALATELVGRYGPVSQWPFESCRVDHTPNGSTKLTLLQPHNESKLCLDYTFYLQPDGTIIRAEDCIADGYSGTLVYEDDNYAIIASRRSEGCLRGGDPCGYCYVTDLTLWNTDRTKGTLLLEGAELGIDFTVLDGPGENGVLSISYHTGLSHSDSTTMVFGDIDLSTGTYTEIAREWLD